MTAQEQDTTVGDANSAGVKVGKTPAVNFILKLNIMIENTIIWFAPTRGLLYNAVPTWYDSYYDNLCY